MLEKIYSKVKENLILHIIYVPEIDNGRDNIIEENNFLQCSFLAFNKGKTFIPHKHIKKEKTFANYIAQESWLVINGSVKCIFYDIDDTIICERIIKSGCSSFTLHGGHNYEILEDNTLIYEYKTGPYEGIEKDKVFINNENTI